jgi:SAM-dependent methyltransferase
MNNYKLFYKSLFNSVYIRIIIGYLRWFYFVKIKNNLRNIESDKSISNTISHNMQVFKKFPLTDFAMTRMDRLLYATKAIELIGENSKILAIGPRTESDILKLKGLFPKGKIIGLDLISYSNWIQLGDAHNLSYKSNEFDCVISGWVLAYSNQKEKMINEMIRVVKDKGIISIGMEYDKSSDISSIKSIENILEKNKFKYKIIFNYDALMKDKSSEESYEISRLHGSQILVCFQLFK